MLWLLGQEGVGAGKAGVEAAVFGVYAFCEHLTLSMSAKAACRWQQAREAQVLLVRLPVHYQALVHAPQVHQLHQQAALHVPRHRAEQLVVVLEHAPFLPAHEAASAHTKTHSNTETFPVRN